MHRHIPREQLLENLGIPDCPYNVEVTFQGAIRFSDILDNNDYVDQTYFFYEPAEALAAFEEYRRDYLYECEQAELIDALED